MREQALQFIQKLPDNVSDAELADALILLGNILKGCAQAENGESITTEELLKEMTTW